MPAWPAFVRIFLWRSATANGLCEDIVRNMPQQSVAALAMRQSGNGVTLRHILRSGRHHADSEVGCYAGDAESYQRFAALFDPVIAKLHGTSVDYRYTEDFGVGSIPVLSPA